MDIARPSTPVVTAATADSLTVQWYWGNGSVSHQTQICYRQVGSPKWSMTTMQGVLCDITLNGLSSRVDWQFKVRGVVANTECGPWSSVGGPYRTLTPPPQRPVKGKRFCAQSFAHENSEERMKGDVLVRKLKLEHIHSCTESMTRILQFGSPRRFGIRARREKTIMLVGATGVGKSTLLDGMVNYLLGVERGDNYRYSIIDVMDNEKDKPQAQSQTEWITLYRLCAIDPHRADTIINIIDTPGFGDTRGIARDKKLVVQITEFFSRRAEFGVYALDAVCLVAKATETRLTATQRYICASVLGVFGKDIAENIIAAITFFDGSETPLILHALRKSEVPFDRFFNFNNSALFLSPNDSRQITKLFWDVGKESFDQFFIAIDEMEPRSLVQTADVLAERRTLELVTDGLVYTMQDCLLKLHNLEEEEAALKQERREVRENRQYTYTVKVFEVKENPLKKGKRATNCLDCNMTCHKKCTIKNDDNLKKCDAMDSKIKDKKQRVCLVCPKQCLWNRHVVNTHELIREEVYVEKTDAELKLKYKQLQRGVQARKEVVEQLKREVHEVMDEIKDLTQKLKTCKERLSEIALKPNPMTDVDFIDLLITQETTEASEGYLDRIRGLEKVKQQTLAFHMAAQFQNITLK